MDAVVCAFRVPYSTEVRFSQPDHFFNRQELCKAVRLAWASLPKGHECKENLVNTTSASFSEFDPSVVLLHQADGSFFYRRISQGRALEEQAMDLVLYPKHATYTLRKPISLNLAKMFEKGIYDIMVLGQETVVLADIARPDVRLYLCQKVSEKKVPHQARALKLVSEIIRLVPPEENSEFLDKIRQDLTSGNSGPILNQILSQPGFPSAFIQDTLVELFPQLDILTLLRPSSSLWTMTICQ